jgi:chromosome segregation ATPase
MATIKEKIDSLQKQEEANCKALALLRQELDDMADAGKADELAAIQSEIGARQAMADSYARRLAKLQGELSDEGRARQKTANLERVKRVGTELDAAAAIAGKVDKTLAQLAAQLGEMHKHGDAAREEAGELLRQLPSRQREHYYAIFQSLGLRDSTLGALLEGEMQRLGVFYTLAPHPSLQLQRHDLGAVGEALAARSKKLQTAVAGMAEQINRDL